MRQRWLILGLLVIMTLTMAGGTVIGQDEDTRSFHLGFTPFPYAISLEAVLFTYRTIAEDADLIVHHFDSGVPWPEALAGEPYQDHLRNEWTTRRNQVPDDHKLLVTVTPISISRDSLAPYWGDGEDLPLPPPFDGYSFDHPDVIQAYHNHCLEVIDFFEPDYFLMGIEVNLLMKLRPDLWDAYVTLHRSVYNALKQAHPDLPIMVSMTGMDLLEGYTDSNKADQAQAWDDIIDYTDIVGISLYPYMSSYMTHRLPLQVFDELAALTDKPIAIAETGYPAQSFHVAMGVDLQFDSDQRKQAGYIDLLLEKAQEHGFLFVVNFVLRDYDALWEAIGGREDLTILWRDTGLYDEDGNERQALTLWREWLARPFVPNSD